MYKEKIKIILINPVYYLYHTLLEISNGSFAPFFRNSSSILSDGMQTAAHNKKKTVSENRNRFYQSNSFRQA